MTRDDLLAAARAAREAALAADTLAVHLKRLADSAPPPAPLLPAQLATPQPIEASAPVSTHQASEVTPSGGAEALPSGWKRWASSDPWFTHPHNGAGVLHVAANEFSWRSNDGNGTAPTLAQAMCAALGIHYAQDAISGNYYASAPGAPDLVRDEQRIKSWKVCARAALEIFHARQQPAPAAALRQEADEIRKAARELTAPMHRADDACKCTYRPDGHRDVSRFCTLHGASWQTLAEQRSELHEDGTPRAGCGYCASTPELDARERGLR